MIIKSSQTLVKEALEIVKTISPEEALNLSKNNQCNLIELNLDEANQVIRLLELIEIMMMYKKYTLIFKLNNYDCTRD